MSYSNIEARVQDLLQALARFDDQDVTRGDPLVLERGHAPYVILWPGPVEWLDESEDGLKVSVEWTVIAQVFEKFRTDEASHISFEATRQDVLETILSNPTLSGLTWVQGVRLIGGDSPIYLRERSGGVTQFISQRIGFAVAEDIPLEGKGEFCHD